MASIKVRWLLKRPQKSSILYYWYPPKTEQQKWGIQPRRLAERTNSLGDTINEAEKLNAETDAIRAGRVFTRLTYGSVSWLINEFHGSPEFERLSVKTQRFYQQNLAVIDGFFGDTPVQQLTRAIGLELYKAIAATGKMRKASAVMQSLRRLYSFAYDHEYATGNPFEKPRVSGPKGRNVVWTPDQVEAICSAAPQSIELAVRLSYELCQRQGDVLHLSWGAYDGDRITIVQSKTGRRIQLPIPDQLRHFLNTVPRTSPIMVINERTGKPYDEHNFRKAFRKARDDAQLPQKLQFLDLRRSGATELGAAGATDDEIRAVTGHMTRNVVSTYVKPDERMAESAIKKRQTHARRAVREGTKSAQN